MVVSQVKDDKSKLVVAILVYYGFNYKNCSIVPLVNLASMNRLCNMAIIRLKTLQWFASSFLFYNSTNVCNASPVYLWVLFNRFKHHLMILRINQTWRLSSIIS